MKIGFSKEDISPPLGTPLGGYAVDRPCAGIHDPLYAKVLVLEQDGTYYALVVLDLVSVDDALRASIACALERYGIPQQHLIVAAIHSHAAPWGNIPGKGSLEAVNREWMPQSELFAKYMESVVEAVSRAVARAAGDLEPFTVRCAQGSAPAVGSNRHTGAPAGGTMTALEFRTESGRRLTVYRFGCHPTVLNAQNFLASADFTGAVESLLGVDQAMFLNGAAGDISTRFTRQAASFEECQRMAQLTADHIRQLLQPHPFRKPQPLVGAWEDMVLQPRPIETVESARQRLAHTQADLDQAEGEGRSPGECRILRSYVEGALVNLQAARTMDGLTGIPVRVAAFRFCGLNFATIPGELFSSLLPEEPLGIIGYANGYCRYLPDMAAYDSGCYEALAALVARGESEKLMNKIRKRISSLPKTMEVNHESF